MKKTELKEAIEKLEPAVRSGIWVDALKTALETMKIHLESMPDNEFIPPDGCPVEVGSRYSLRISTGKLDNNGNLLCYHEHPASSYFKANDPYVWNTWRFPIAVAIPWEAKEDSVNPVPGKRIIAEFANGSFSDRSESESFIWNKDLKQIDIVRFILLPEGW